MNTQTVRITETDHAALSALSRQSGKPMTVLLGEAIRALQREQLLQRTNEAYATLKKNPKLWEEEVRERKLWDTTLPDSME